MRQTSPGRSVVAWGAGTFADATTGVGARFVVAVRGFSLDATTDATTGRVDATTDATTDLGAIAGAEESGAAIRNSATATGCSSAPMRLGSCRCGPAGAPPAPPVRPRAAWIAAVRHK